MVSEQNTQNDYDKHIEAFERHFAALYGDGWEQMTMAEAVKLLALRTLGLNGGGVEQIPEAAEKVGFDRHNVVAVGDNTYQVLTMIEFVDNTVETLH
jgi:hypothetical protein